MHVTNGLLCLLIAAVIGNAPAEQEGEMRLQSILLLVFILAAVVFFGVAVVGLFR